jgi:hypothetical protein
MAQTLECLLCRHKALNSNPSPTKKKKKKERKKERKIMLVALCSFRGKMKLIGRLIQET